MHFLEDFGKRHGKTTGPGSYETFGPFGPPYQNVFKKERSVLPNKSAVMII